ncbi:AAA family ATPase, partial [Sulfuricurvum sp.]|uniref:AAA family ATPase n=1 Tax=Sulfuricurvum sp. TaxID=2025608 RepID=UPI003BB6B23D
MKIEKVQIKNFKSLRDIEIELRGLTLITGINSSGKSTFIQSLLLLKENRELINQIVTNGMMMSSMKEHSEPLRTHIIKLVEDTKNQPLSLEGEYIHLGDKKDIFNQEVYDEDINISINTLLFTINYNNLSLSTTCPIPISNVINLFADDFQYLHTDRIQPNRTYELSERHIRKNLIGSKGEYTAHYLDENRHESLKIKALKHENAKTDRLLDNVSFWLSEISNGIEVLPKKHLDTHQASLSYRYIYGENTTNEYSPLNVGFGITYVLPIIVAILKSKQGDLLIIENPESHLHPAGQSKIARLCAIAVANGVQIIVESHSDHFLNAIRVATKQHLLKPEDSVVYYFSKISDSMETKVEQLL